MSDDDQRGGRPEDPTPNQPAADGDDRFSGTRELVLHAVAGGPPRTGLPAPEVVGDLDSHLVDRYPDSWYRRQRAYEEAKRTVNRQTEWLREIDTKAMRTLRFNAILLGVVVPTATFAVQFGLVRSAEVFYNVHVGAGVAALVGSTALAGVTYTATSLDVGVSSDDIRTAQRHGLSDRQLHDTLVTSYAGWIRSNRRTLLRNSLLVTATIVLTIYALALLALGAGAAVLGGIPAPVRYGAYLGLVAVTLGCRLV